MVYDIRNDKPLLTNSNFEVMKMFILQTFLQIISMSRLKLDDEVVAQKIVTDRLIVIEM